MLDVLPCRLGVGRLEGGKEAQTSCFSYLLPLAHAPLVPLWLLRLCAEPLLQNIVVSSNVWLFFSLEKTHFLASCPPPPSHLLFFQDKTLPVHKLTQHYDPVSSQVQCQNTEASSILILLEEKKCVLSQ